MNKQVIDKILTNTSPQSIPEAIFVEHQNGLLDQRGYRVANAVWVAENSRKYPVIVYQPLQQILKDYASARSSGKRERDASLNYRLGQWVWGITQSMNENVANYELLVWARTICDRENMTDRVSMIDRRLSQYIEANPSEEFLVAIESQRLDGISRQNQRGMTTT